MAHHIAHMLAFGAGTLGALGASTNEAATPVKIFLLMGQSNCVGFGEKGDFKGGKEGTLTNAIENNNKYTFMIEGGNTWKTSQMTRNVANCGSRKKNSNDSYNDWMAGPAGRGGNTFGPELGIGHRLEEHFGDDDRIMVLKSCTGNRALGWDLLPFKTPQTEWIDDDTDTTWVYAGSGDKAVRWVKGSVPKEVNWHAGIQLEGDLARIDEVLDDLSTYYPGAAEDDYEVAGVFWWQGDKDSRNGGHLDMYERNLVNLIDLLRDRYSAPNLPFVTASLGQSTREKSCVEDIKGGCGGKILLAMENAAKSKDNVKLVETHSMAQGGRSNSHYNKNAEVYMDVGLAMGEAIVSMLETTPPGVSSTQSASTQTGTGVSATQSASTQTGTKSEPGVSDTQSGSGTVMEPIIGFVGFLTTLVAALV